MHRHIHSHMQHCRARYQLLYSCVKRTEHHLHRKYQCSTRIAMHSTTTIKQTEEQRERRRRRRRNNAECQTNHIQNAIYNSLFILHIVCMYSQKKCVFDRIRDVSIFKVFLSSVWQTNFLLLLVKQVRRVWNRFVVFILREKIELQGKLHQLATRKTSHSEIKFVFRITSAVHVVVALACFCCNHCCGCCCRYFLYSE